MTIPWRRPTATAPMMVAIAIANSVRRIRQSARSDRISISRTTAPTTTAASAAVGTLSSGRVKKISTVTISSAAVTLAICDLPPTISTTAVRAALALVVIPPDTRCQVRRAESHQIAVRVDLVPVPVREGRGAHDRVRRCDEGDRRGCRQERDDVAGGHVREADRRQPRGQTPDHRHVPQGGAEQLDQEGRPDDREQGPGDAPLLRGEHQDHPEASHPYRDDLWAGVSQAAHDLDRSRQRSVFEYLESEELGKLAEDHDDGEAGLIAEQHRPGQEVRHEPEPERPRHDQDPAHDESNGSRELGVAELISRRERCDGRRHHRRRGGVKGDHELGR